MKVKINKIMLIFFGLVFFLIYGLVFIHFKNDDTKYFISIIIRNRLIVSNNLKLMK